VSEPRDPTTRFSDRVENYRKHRPGYPDALVDLLEQRAGLRPGSRVADIGSGTGLLTERLLRRGYTVIGVEPNGPMREAGEAALASYERFRSVDGTAESTGLEARSVEAIVAAQAFHWFDRPRARAEFERILEPGGPVAVLWNDRRKSGPFHEEYDRLLLEHGTDYRQVDHTRITPEEIAAFFGSAGCRCDAIENLQPVDLDGMRGRLVSCSYIPNEGEPGYAEAIQACDALFRRHQRDGQVVLEYDLRVYHGLLT
jgi:SAM-dependent methyltransferase